MAGPQTLPNRPASASSAPQGSQGPHTSAPTASVASERPEDGRPAPTSPQPPQSPARRLGKFRVRSGDHIDDQLAWLPRPRVLAFAAEAGLEGADRLPDPAGQPFSPGSLRAAVRAARVAERRWKAGQVIASPKPLSSRDPAKYERVGDEVPESAGEPTLKRVNDEIDDSYTEVAAQQSFEAERQADDLHRLDVGRLRELAYEEGIDLGAADTKAAILSCIRRVRKAVAEDR